MKHVKIPMVARYGEHSMYPMNGPIMVWSKIYTLMVMKWLHILCRKCYRWLYTNWKLGMNIGKSILIMSLCQIDKKNYDPYINHSYINGNIYQKYIYCFKSMFCFLEYIKMCHNFYSRIFKSSIQHLNIFINLKKNNIAFHLYFAYIFNIFYHIFYSIFMLFPLIIYHPLPNSKKKYYTCVYKRCALSHQIIWHWPISSNHALSVPLLICLWPESYRWSTCGKCPPNCPDYLWRFC